MDNLAPAPTERTFDNVARSPEQGLTARRRAARKAPSAPAPEKRPEPELALEPEPNLAPEPEADHQLDVLA
jgi:hypothetical protein